MVQITETEEEMVTATLVSAHDYSKGVLDNDEEREAFVTFAQHTLDCRAATVEQWREVMETFRLSYRGTWFSFEDFVEHEATDVYDLNTDLLHYIDLELMVHDWKAYYLVLKTNNGHHAIFTD
jgi:hypothetical protein